MALADDLFTVALLHHKADRADQAETIYRQLLELEPHHVRAMNNLALLLHARQDPEAMLLLGRAISLDPNSYETHNNLGTMRLEAEQHYGAIACFERSLALRPHDSSAGLNLGVALNAIGHHARAAHVLSDVLRVAPGSAEAYNALAMSRWALGQHDVAVNLVWHALVLDPGFKQAHENSGHMLLALGRWAEGWAEFEHRKFQVVNDLGLPLWDRRSFHAGRRVMVWCEQGLGDHILQLGMLPQLIQLDAAVGFGFVFRVDRRLIPLLRRRYPAACFVDQIEPALQETLWAQIPFYSLGQMLRPDTASFGWSGPYVRPDQARAKKIRDALDVNPIKLLVGISWASPASRLGAQKSIPLHDWVPLLSLDACEFLEMQYGDKGSDLDMLFTDHGLAPRSTQDIDPAQDIDGLAAAVAACDLVITCSNVTAHLAGALGVPCWVVVPHGLASFWHWGATGSTTPWYPSVTVIRKQEPLSWASTMAAVALRLLTFCETKADIPATTPSA